MIPIPYGFLNWTNTTTPSMVARAESMHVFIDAGLKAVKNKPSMHLEVGLGTGLNCPAHRSTSATGNYHQIQHWNHSRWKRNTDSIAPENEPDWREDSWQIHHTRPMVMHRSHRDFCFIAPCKTGNSGLHDPVDLVYLGMMLCTQGAAGTVDDEVFRLLYDLMSDNSILVTYYCQRRCKDVPCNRQDFRWRDFRSARIKEMLRARKTADILIIGGGIAGLSMAAALDMKGMPFVLCASPSRARFCCSCRSDQSGYRQKIYFANTIYGQLMASKPKECMRILLVSVVKSILEAINITRLHRSAEAGEAFDALTDIPNTYLNQCSFTYRGQVHTEYGGMQVLNGFRGCERALSGNLAMLHFQHGTKHFVLDFPFHFRGNAIIQPSDHFTPSLIAEGIRPPLIKAGNSFRSDRTRRGASREDHRSTVGRYIYQRLHSCSFAGRNMVGRGAQLMD